MRLAAAVFAVACLTAGDAWSDPAPQPVGAEVRAAIRTMEGGQVEAGRATLERLARSGHADAAEALGELTRVGALGLRADPVLACQYFALGSGQRGDAMHNVAFCYETGAMSGTPDFPRAAAHYQQAADMGNAKSKCALGNFYRMGRGVSKDQPRGIALCREAAEAGVADAQTDLGDIYIMGQGVPKDVAAARGWYEKAAAQGQRNALMTLGQIYWNADGVTKDNAKAADYWRRSYAAGRKDAAKFLGDEAFVRAKVSDGVWTLEGLTEAQGWYEKGAAAETPAFRAEADERAKLAAELAGAMRRRDRPH
ncbi:MAG: tetratricopeptide repeat protein [Phenylobacterium sp.]|nr:tetratricopeptide repeat protein [Phenylobacterium sp.]